MANDFNSKDSFIYPYRKYRGEFKPEALAFNANLQEFAQRVSLICSLETGGKISLEEAYSQIQTLWHQLKHSKAELFELPQPPHSDAPEV